MLLKFRKRAKVSAELNMTPMIDIIFQLIIFFLLSSSFIVQSGIKVDLPKAHAEEIKQEKDIVVSVDRDRKLFIDQTPIEETALPARLAELMQQKGDRVLIIKADEAVNHGFVVTVMDLAKEAGFTRLAIATEKKR